MEDKSDSAQILRAKQAAQYIGMAPSTLAKWRMRNCGPRYIRAGKRIVVYRRRDLDRWLDEHELAAQPGTSRSDE